MRILASCRRHPQAWFSKERRIADLLYLRCSLPCKRRHQTPPARRNYRRRPLPSCPRALKQHGGLRSHFHGNPLVHLMTTRMLLLQPQKLSECGHCPLAKLIRLISNPTPCLLPWSGQSSIATGFCHPAQHSVFTSRCRTIGRLSCAA